MSGSLASRTAAMIDVAITRVEANRCILRAGIGLADAFGANHKSNA
jgi:hypothetical protein